MNACWIKTDRSLVPAVRPVDILDSVLTALHQRNIPTAVDQFADDLTFHDHALDLDFTEKERLLEFFEKSRELFPDTAVEIVAAFECGDYASAEWKLTATEAQSFGTK